MHPGQAVAWLLSPFVYSIFWVLGVVFLLVFVRRAVRHGWLAGLIVTLILSATALGSPGQAVLLPIAVLTAGMIVAVTIRFGVLATIVLDTCRRIAGYCIYSSDPSNWNFYAGMITVAAILALAWWGAKTALAGRPLFGGALQTADN
jgi:hypothetical protein